MHLDGLSLCLTGREVETDVAVDVGGGAPTAKQQQHEVAASCRKLSHFGVSTFSEGWGGYCVSCGMPHFFISLPALAARQTCVRVRVCVYVCHCLAIKIHTAAIFFVPIEPFWIFCRHY